MRLVIGVVVGLGLGVGTSIQAQDIEMRSILDGAPLPQAYYDDIARNPDMYTLPNTWPSGSRRAFTNGDPVSGSLAVLVLPALFSDSPDPRVPSDEIQRILFDGPSEPGTVPAFFSELSGGRLKVTGQVTPWVRTSLTLEQVTAGNAGFGSEARVGEYILDALEKADAVVDFRQFDNDGPDGVPSSGDDDGVLDVLAIEFMEVAASCGGPGIWPHRSGIAWQNGGVPFVSDDVGPNGPIVANGYIMQSVSDCSGEGTQTSNVIAHEMGHVFGLPDLYHAVEGILPEERRWVVGCWGLMAAGSWGCGSAAVRVDNFGPTRMSPWSLARLGWVEYQEVGPEVTRETFLVEPTSRGGRPLLIPLVEGGSEYLILETRVKEGFDAPLPASGVLAYYWDTEASLKPAPDSDDPYGYHLMEADGGRNLVLTHNKGGNRGEATDVLGFPGSLSVLSSATTPSTNSASGELSTVAIHQVQMTPEGALITLSTARSPSLSSALGTAPRAHRRFLRSHAIAGGAQPYQVEMVDGPTWMTVTATGTNVFVGGVPEAEGTAPFTIRVTDALGTTVDWTEDLNVLEFAVTEDELVRALLTETPTFTETEVTILDQQGNQNGVFDVGDARAYLRRLNETPQ